MPIGYFSEGVTRYILEARDQEGRCVYRKYTDEDRWNYFFNLIPPTQCGIHFRSRAIESDRDTRFSLIARPNVCTYISREFMKLQGKDPIPERRRNEQMLKTYGRRGFVNETYEDRSLMPPKLEEFVDPETVEGQLVPSEDMLDIADDVRAQMIANSSLPSAEKAPEGFNMEEWLEGNNFETPEELRTEPQSPDPVPALATAEADDYADQLIPHAPLDERETHNQRVARERKAAEAKKKGK